MELIGDIHDLQEKLHAQNAYANLDVCVDLNDYMMMMINDYGIYMTY